MQEPLTNEEQDIPDYQPFSGEELSVFIDDMYGYFIYDIGQDGDTGEKRRKNYHMYLFIKSKVVSKTRN